MHAQRFIGHRIVRAMANAGLPVPSFATELGIHPDAPMPSPDDLVAQSVIHRLWEDAMRAGAPPSFPIDVALVELADMRSPLTFLCASSATVGEALAHFIEGWHAVTGLGAWSIGFGDGVVHLTFDGRRPSSIGESCHIEYLVADLIHTGRCAIGGEVTPVSVSFRHSAPASTDAHRRLFGDGLVFDATTIGFALPASLLEAPMATASPGLALVLGQHIDEKKKRVPSPASAVQAVRDALRAAFDGRGNVSAAAVSLETIARQLGVGARTLLRRLRAEDASFQQILDDVRRDLAHELLALPNKSSKEIAAALGFSDPRAFARAFRRWTGQSPRSLPTREKAESGVICVVSPSVPSLSSSNG